MAYCSPCVSIITIFSTRCKTGCVVNVVIITVVVIIVVVVVAKEHSTAAEAEAIKKLFDEFPKLSIQSDVIINEEKMGKGVHYNSRYWDINLTKISSSVTSSLILSLSLSLSLSHPLSLPCFSG